MKDTTICGVEGSYHDPSTTSSARRMPVWAWMWVWGAGNAADGDAVEVSTDLLRISLCPPPAAHVMMMHRASRKVLLPSEVPALLIYWYLLTI